MVRMTVSGAGVSGSVQAFLRSPPVVQASLSDISKLVAPTEFAGSIALIIGGSRGLGALTAKIIAAGGGKVIVTYAIGRKEAMQLAEEIHAHIPQGVCDVLPYDARLRERVHAVGSVARERPGGLLGDRAGCRLASPRRAGR